MDQRQNASSYESMSSLSQSERVERWTRRVVVGRKPHQSNQTCGARRADASREAWRGGRTMVDDRTGRRHYDDDWQSNTATWFQRFRRHWWHAQGNSNKSFKEHEDALDTPSLLEVLAHALRDAEDAVSTAQEQTLVQTIHPDTPMAYRTYMINVQPRNER